MGSCVSAKTNKEREAMKIENAYIPVIKKKKKQCRGREGLND